MSRPIRFLTTFAILLSPFAVGLAQEKSVKPGVNEPFKHADIAEWVTKFEGESRET